MLCFRLAEYDSQIGSKIVLCPASSNGITQNLTTTAANFTCLLQCASFFDFLQNCQQLQRFDLFNGALANIGEDIFLKAVQKLFRVPMRPCGHFDVCHSLATDSKLFSWANCNAIFSAFLALLGLMPLVSIALHSSRLCRASASDTSPYIPNEIILGLPAKAVAETTAFAAGDIDQQ
jgi:hypothetical protein